MTPLTANPNAVLLVDAENRILGLASNIASDLKILVTRDPAVYADEAANKPFDTDRPLPPDMVMSSKASKARYPAK